AGGSGVVGHQWPARHAASRDREPTRLVDALTDRVLYALSTLEPSRPSIEGRAEEEGLKPPSVHQIGTKRPRRWGNAGRRYATGPAVKTGNPASRLVAQVAPL